MLRSMRDCIGNFDGGSRCDDCSSSKDHRIDAMVVSRDRKPQKTAIRSRSANSNYVIYCTIYDGVGGGVIC